MFIIAQFLLCFVCVSALRCKDESGNDVDWYILYKLPQLITKDAKINTGVVYMYFKPDSTSWTVSELSINSTQSFLGQTLQPLYKKDASDIVVKVLYNDEHEDGEKTLIMGHTKGVLAFEKSDGFWLVHSVPKFPPPTDETYSYISSGEVYGQSFLCISLKFFEANQIGGLLMYDTPYIYDSFLSSSISSNVPLLADVIKNKHVLARPWNQTIILDSVAGFPFQAFAKYKDFDKDIYSSWIAPFLGTNLVTETWQNGAHKLPSECVDVYTVENILAMTVPYMNLTFKSTHDHSKLAISKSSEKPWVCIGDINRMDPQKRRGGGTVCLKHETVWNAYYRYPSNYAINWDREIIA